MTVLPPPEVCVLRSEALEAWVLPWGARLVQLWWLQAPEAAHNGPRPLSLGFADTEAYRHDAMAIGAVCGRYANRLADARLQRGERTWSLDANHPMGHCIHGGHAGFGQRHWSVVQQDSTQVRLQLLSPDGEMGFPGECLAEVVYGLRGAELHWQASAQVSAMSPVNMVQHSYWNLGAHRDLAHHRLHVPAQRYHPTDARELPLPAVPVAGTPLSFEPAGPVPLNALQALDAALVLDTPMDAAGLRHAATLSVADLALTLDTDRPLLHVYAGCNLRPTAEPLGVAHHPGAGLCLETEDMPNGPALGADVWYGPQRAYHHRMRFAFAAQTG